MVRTFKDYNMSKLYHLEKDNVIMDSLSRMDMGSMTYVGDDKRELVKEIHRLA